MKFHYTYDGSEVIIRDEPVWRATTISAGTLMMKSNSKQEATDPDSSNDQRACLIIAYSATMASQAVNAVGITLEDVYADSAKSSPSCGALYSTTAGPAYAKCIINPGAVYKVEHGQGTADDVAITSTSTSTFTISSSAADIDGHFIYFPLSTAGVKGSLRLCITHTTMDSALVTTGSASDTAIIILPPLKYGLGMDAGATYFTSGACAKEQLGSGSGANINLAIIESYIQRDGLEVMRPNRHFGLNNLHQCNGGTGVRFFYDVALRSHFFGGGTPFAEA